ncbi:MAG: potassium channel family protein [Flavobacteriales bacterium]|nr:potassium channel family protein [Flavobacteriales bacterium]
MRGDSLSIHRTWRAKGAQTERDRAGLPMKGVILRINLPTDGSDTDGQDHRIMTGHIQGSSPYHCGLTFHPMNFFRTIAAFLRNPEYRELLLTTSAVICFGSASYHYIEGWSWLDSIYFSIITLTTIGYGDIAPKTDAGKVFTIFYIIIGIGIILNFINTLYIHYRSSRSKSKGHRHDHD